MNVDNYGVTLVYGLVPKYKLTSYARPAGPIVTLCLCGGASVTVWGAWKRVNGGPMSQDSIPRKNNPPRNRMPADVILCRENDPPKTLHPILLACVHSSCKRNAHERFCFEQ